MATRKRKQAGSKGYAPTSGDGGGSPIGGGGGGPIGGGALAKVIWLQLAQKHKELSDLYKKLARTPIGGKAYGGEGKDDGGGGPIGG